METRKRHEEAQPNYLIHPIDIPAGKVYEEKPSRVPNFKVDVLGATVVFAVIVFAGCLSFYLGFWPGGVTAVLTLFFFLSRLGKVFDIPFAQIKETLFQDVNPRVAPPPRTAALNVNGTYQGEIEVTRNAKVLGGVTLSGRQLDKWESLLIEQGDGKVRRDRSGLGFGLSEIGISTGQYPVLYQALKEAGYIGADDRFTNEGLAWLKRK